jgi:hypothetical protein
MNILIYFMMNVIGRCLVGVVSVVLFGPIALLVLPLRAVHSRWRGQHFVLATELRNMWFWWELHRPLGFERTGAEAGCMVATMQEKDREQQNPELSPAAVAPDEA